MSAIEQVFTIGVVKDEHPRLYAEALAELAKLRAELAAAQRERDEARARVAELEADARWACESWPNSNDDYFRLDHEDAMRNLKASICFSEDDDSATLTPRLCVTCAMDAAREMREMCAEFADDFDCDDLSFDLPTSIGAGIRALPLPAECADCNPLKPESEATR